MNLQHRKIMAAFVSCAAIFYQGAENGMAQPPNASTPGSALDANTAVSRTASLPPPMPLQTETTQPNFPTVDSLSGNVPVPGFTPQPGLPPTFPMVSPSVTPLPSVNVTPAAIPTVTPPPTQAELQPRFNIPGLESASNFDGTLMPGSQPYPASPLFVAPSVLTPAPGEQGIEALKSLNPIGENQPKADNRLDEAVSPYATPNPPETLNYYVSPRLEKKTEPAGGPLVPASKEIIVLTTGQEFSGEVIQRGNEWRIRLVNGSVISVPGNKVSHIRKVLANPDESYDPRAIRYTPKPHYMNY